MAKYTIELRDIIANGHNIFPFHYEFYDEKYRAKFEQDFIRHFYFREIGSETIDRFIVNLEDKMNTVFPSYNEMLKARQIEYQILDNYYLSETTKRKIETQGNSSGVSSSVAQSFDDQQTDTADTTNNRGSGEQNENTSSDTASVNLGKTRSTKKEDSTNASATETTVTGESEKEGSNSSANTQVENKKFLDTPQGLTDLTNTDYLTTLNQDNSNGLTATDSKETEKNNQSSGGATVEKNSLNLSENGDTDTNNVSATNTGRNATENTSGVQNSVGSTSFKGEQKTTADNNTRLKNDNTSVEETEVIHKGNIGVDSDAVMIQKHLKLQKEIAQTFKLFFDECEDLFMGVY